MVIVKVTLDDGDWFTTRMNAMKEEALAYYEVGLILRMGFAGDDLRMIAGVEVLSD